MTSPNTKRKPQRTASRLPSESNVVFRVADWPMAHFVQIERLHQRNASRLLDAYGLPHREWRILALLSEHGALGINQIADGAAAERSTTSKMIARLTARGLIERSTSSVDARASRVSLTRAGQRLLAETIPVVQGLLESYQRGMSASDYAALMRLLQAFRRSVASAEAAIGGNAKAPRESTTSPRASRRSSDRYETPASRSNADRRKSR